MDKIIGSVVKTPKGEGIIDGIYITELNLLMVKVRFDKIWINYRLCELPEIQSIIFNANE